VRKDPVEAQDTTNAAKMKTRGERTTNPMLGPVKKVATAAMPTPNSRRLMLIRRPAS